MLEYVTLACPIVTGTHLYFISTEQLGYALRLLVTWHDLRFPRCLATFYRIHVASRNFSVLGMKRGLFLFSRHFTWVVFFKFKQSLGLTQGSCHGQILWGGDASVS